MVLAEPCGLNRYRPDNEGDALCPISAMADVAMAALYLEGAPRGLAAPKSRWPAVLSLLRSEGPSLGEASRVLRRRGFVEESLALDDSRLLDWAERRLAAGVVLTAASPRYPGPWCEKLGARAPAALWVRGEMPLGPFLAVVGSRYVGSSVRRFAMECGAHVPALGFALVSGGATGCDRAAARGAASVSGRVLEILPCGLNLRRERIPGAAVSPFAPDAEFSGAQAMLRNTLIYALGEAAVLIQARLGEGGTWKGAMAARRQRLCPLIVRAGGGRAAAALRGIGAIGLDQPSDLAPALRMAQQTPFQTCLDF